MEGWTDRNSQDPSSHDRGSKNLLSLFFGFIVALLPFKQNLFFVYLCELIYSHNQAIIQEFNLGTDSPMSIIL